MSETIKRFTFEACARGEHHLCRVWDETYIDGEVRRAGEQCDCPCHVKRAGEKDDHQC